MTTTIANFPPILKGLFDPYRYKVAYGGRGSGKSWAFARAALIKAAQKPMRILCAREVQKSIKNSVHTLLNDQIQELGLGQFYTVTESEIRGANGSTFSFAGLATHTVESIKSFEGCDVVWVEEGQTVSKKSWDILIPTIRKEESEIWVTLNPYLDTDDTYRRFINSPPPKTFLVKINWRDNPWFPTVLEDERKHCKIVDPKGYDNIWEGIPMTVAEGAIYADEYQQMVEDGRITLIRHDPLLKAHAVFDLGWNDAMSIIIAQRSGSELRVIDYIEDTHKTLDWYSDQLKSKQYNWGKIWLPHDAVAKDYKTGKSAAELMTQMGWTVEVLPMAEVEHGIRLARLAFPRIWMDKEKTESLQECLKRYRRIVDQRTMEPKGPLHDEWSHGADAFRYLATCADGFRNDNTSKRRHADEFQGGWMQ
jgi:phage terminase large subunit